MAFKGNVNVDSSDPSCKDGYGVIKLALSDQFYEIWLWYPYTSDLRIYSTGKPENKMILHYWIDKGI